MSTGFGVPRRTLAIVVVLPLVVMAVAVAIVLSWRSQLPDPVAAHWGKGGEVDGVGSLGSTVALIAGLITAFTAVFGAIVIATKAADRILCVSAAACTVWFSVFLSTVLVGTTAVQRGAASAYDVESPDLVLVLGLALAAAVAAAAAYVTPASPSAHQKATEPIPVDAARLDVGEAERAVWTRRAWSRPGVLIGGAVFASGVLLSVALWSWIPFAITAFASVVVLFAMVWRVTVDRRGLTVTALFGLPRITVPLSEMDVAKVAQISPLGDFGGYGIRMGRDKRTGIALRAGEAIEVRRANGRSLVVTVDDAATAVALLNTLADRSRA